MNNETMTVNSLVDLVKRKIINGSTPIYIIYDEVNETSFSGLVSIRQYTIQTKDELVLCVRPGFPLVPDERSKLQKLAEAVLKREAKRAARATKPKRKRAKKGA